MTGDMTDDDRQRIIDALYAGRKIEAIKIYRRLRDTDLMAAKQFIDELESRLREESPERFATRRAQGCGTTVLGLAILLALLAGGMVGALCG